MVQVASGGKCQSQGQLEILSLNHTAPRLVKSIQVGAPVLCLEYVTEHCATTEGQEAPGAAKTGNTICVGLQDGR